MKKKLLFIEDEKALRDVFQLFYTQMNYEVYTAAQASEGFEVCKKVRPDIVMLDYNLPGINGIEIGRQIQSCPEEYGNPKLIVVTGSLFSPKEDLQKWREACNIAAFFEKPFNFPDLSNKIVELLE